MTLGELMARLRRSNAEAGPARYDPDLQDAEVIISATYDGGYITQGRLRTVSVGKDYVVLHTDDEQYLAPVGEDDKLGLAQMLQV